jgi:hypothetical protein
MKKRFYLSALAFDISSFGGIGLQSTARAFASNQVEYWQIPARGLLSPVPRNQSRPRARKHCDGHLGHHPEHHGHWLLPNN